MTLPRSEEADGLGLKTHTWRNIWSAPPRVQCSLVLSFSPPGRGSGSLVKNSFVVKFVPGFPTSGDHSCVSALEVGAKTTNLDGKQEELPRGEAPSTSHTAMESFPRAGCGVRGGQPEPRAPCPSWDGTVQSWDGTTRHLHQLCAVAARLRHGVVTGRDSAVVIVGNCCCGDLQNRNMSYVQKKPEKERVSSNLERFWKGFLSGFSQLKNMWTRCAFTYPSKDSDTSSLLRSVKWMVLISVL